ncbi:MAG: LysM peptidoglycan-binding domain-containing protein [Omnitrophica WOR_2 bacterium]
MRLYNKKRRLALGLFLTWLFTALACSFPVQRSSDLPYYNFGATLTAQAHPVRAQLKPATATQSSSSLTVINPATPAPQPGLTPTPLQSNQSNASSFLYYTQPGDTLPALASRFGVSPSEIASSKPVPAQEYLEPGQQLTIPNRVGITLYAAPLLPDSEVVYSPSTVGFNIQDTIQNARGYLSSYQEDVKGEQLSGADILRLVSRQTSVNPRLLLALLDYRSGWVTSQPDQPVNSDYPLGFYVPEYRGLYLELSLAAKVLNMGYYGWRSGALTQLDFSTGASIRIAPGLNAGSVALQYLFSRIDKTDTWERDLYGPENFTAFYQKMFGDPWARAARVEPLIPAGLAQPALELPFIAGEEWSYTSGPHDSWNTGTPRGALDFAPITGEKPCAVSFTWVTASAAGVIARSDHNVVEIDLDGDGNDQTGWVILYMHVASREVIALGTSVYEGDRIGHPSCEGGDATGTHVHMARKYNGEWLPADGPAPFVLSGWTAHEGPGIFDGTLTKGDQVVSAHPDGSHNSMIVR